MFQVDEYLDGQRLTDFVEYVARMTEAEMHYDILATVLKGGDARNKLIELFNRYEQEDAHRQESIKREETNLARHREQPQYIAEETINQLWGSYE